MTKAFKALCSLTLCVLFTGQVSAQNLWCNDQINVTVNHQCAIELNVDAFLEGNAVNDPDYQNGLYTFEIYNHTGIIVLGDNTGITFGGGDMSEWVNSLLFYKVYFDGELHCWGTVLLEDKTPPYVECDVCPPINGNSPDDYDPNCIRNCYEQEIIQANYDLGIRNNIVLEDYEDFIDLYVSDNCNNWDAELTSYYDSWTDFGPCEGARLVRTWNIAYRNYDNSVGTVTCVREYFFQPVDLGDVKRYPLDPNTNSEIISPIENCLILPKGVVVVPCDVGLEPWAVAGYFDDPNTFDWDSDDDNVDPDENDVDLIIENQEGIPYAFPHFYQRGVGSGLHAQAIDNEVCNIIIGYHDTDVDNCAPGCIGNRKIVREWTILDWCSGEFIHYNQILKSVDIAGPNITVPVVTKSVDPWACAANVRLPLPDHIFDNCDNFYSYSIGYTGGYEVTGDPVNGFVVHNLPLGTHSIEYRSEDCCGNVGQEYMELIIEDNTPPVAVSHEYVVISLTNIGNPVNGYQGHAKLWASALDNGSYDSCSDVTYKVRRDANCTASDANWGDFVTFCCEDLEGLSAKEITVELRIRDENGNENIVWTTVLLEDKSTAYPTTPPHMFLTCDMDYHSLDLTGGLPRFYGACGEGILACDTLEVIKNTEPRQLRLSDGVVINGIPIEAPAYDPSCGAGAVRRQFRDCGGGVQWLVILPANPFDNSSIVWPNDRTVDCDDYDNGDPDWLETSCNLVGVSVERDTFIFEDNACMKILNHWSIINWCLYDPTDPNSLGIYHHTQVVKIVDTQDPEIVVADSICYSVLEDCTSEDILLSATGLDNGKCGSRWIKWDLSVDLYSNWTEDYFYSSDNPQLLSNGDYNPYHIPKSANNAATYVALPDGIPGSKVWHRAIWRVYDGCGNNTSKMIYFQITDKKPPTPYCLNLSTAVMSNGEVELWAIDLNKGSFDNCSPSDVLLYTFTDIAPPARKDDEYDSNDDLQWYNGTFWYYNSEELDAATGAGEYEKQDDYGGEVHRWEPGLQSAGKVFTAADADSDGFVDVPVYVWDECENIDFCMVNVRLVDNGGGGMAMVAGNVTTEFGEPVENITTEMQGPLNYNVSDLTDEKGDYAFINTPFFADYDLKGTKVDDYLNGVSTLDLVLMQRHILGQQKFDSPYTMIAADVNNDKQITAVDLLDLRKLILGIYDELPHNASWRMINAKQPLSLAFPWNFDETITIEDLVDDHMDEDFIGVKIGDVNGTVIANAVSEPIDARSDKVIGFVYQDQDLQESDVFELTVKNTAKSLVGYQFTMNIEGLELIGLEGKYVSESNYVVVDDQLRVSINSNAHMETGDLMNFRFKAKTNARVSDILNINSSATRAEAYLETEEGFSVQNIALNENTDSVVLYPNQPNPFNDRTMISFELPANSDVSLKVYSIDGRLLKTIKGAYPKGYNSIYLERDELGVSGMLYYEFETEDFRSVNQMIIIE